MSTTKIYFAHALTNAPDEFRERMFRLRGRIAKIPEVTILDYNWVPGKGPLESINTFEKDQGQVRYADLLVAVIDVTALGLGGEINCRLEIKKPLLVFFPMGTKVTRYVTDGIRHVRQHLIRKGKNGIAFRDFPDPIGYANDNHIYTVVNQWVYDQHLIVV